MWQGKGRKIEINIGILILVKIVFNLVIKSQVVLQYFIPYVTFTMFIVHMSAVITAFGHHAQILRPVSAVSHKNHFLVEVGVFIIIITAVS